MQRTSNRYTLALAAAAAVLAAAPAAQAKGGSFNRLPAFVSGEVITRHYDGLTNDLLTGGLGRSGLALSSAPAFADPLAPSAEELRTRAIHGNYRALVDTAPGGGYGELFGPNVAADGTVTDGEGLIAGTEVLAFASGGERRGGDHGRRGHRRGPHGRNVTMMVQVPDSFDPDNACIVTAPSSGSRGVYGAVGTAGEWGLKNGCAVAYTDKGTGTGAHDLSDNTVGLIDGTREDAQAAGAASTFTARVSEAERAAFDAEFPGRFAFKHAHSQRNPEADWGQDVLDSVEFAFYVLNELYGEQHRNGKIRRTLFAHNTIVIASSVSNGGGSSVRAAELDRHGLIDGVAVSEPNVNPRYDRRFSIVQGDGAPLYDHSRDLYDYTTTLNVYQGCASADADAIADDLGLPPLNFAPSAAACQSLRDLGLIEGDDLATQAAEAQAAINAAGILPEQNVLMPSHWYLNVPQAIAVTYANSYGRVSVLENLCGYSMGATAAGEPAALGAEQEAALFGASNGIPPTGGVNLINNEAPGGALENRASTPDQNLDGALCLRALSESRDPVTGKRLRGAERALSRALRNGIRQVLATGDLRGKPAIFVTGRADAILPPNHTSRAYFGRNRMVEGGRSGLRYVEVLNAQHLDVLNSLTAFPGFAARYIPLHHYFNQAMDRMLDHLRNGTPLPASQVVRTLRRGFADDGSVPGITAANLPDIALVPAHGDAIVFRHRQVRIPE